MSEARAESVASLLKRYGPRMSTSRLTTDRVIEKAILRCSGITADGSDDLLLLRCWWEYFNGSQKFSFFYNRARKSREKKFPVAGGSSVIATHLKKRAHASASWRQSIPALRKLSRARVRTINKWHRILRRDA